MRSPLASLLLLTLLVLVRPVAAEGVAADPISVGDLDRYARRLDLSDAQRASLRPAYDAYLERCRALREDAIDPFMSDHPNFSGMSSLIPTDVEAARATRDSIESINRELAAADEAFFARWYEILSDSQAERLPEIQTDRRRARFLHGPGQRSWHGALDIDLSHVYFELAADLDAETRLTADAAVDTYARTLTRRAELMHDFGLTHRYRMTRKAAETNTGDGAADFHANAKIIREELTNLAQHADDVASVHRSLERQLRLLVTPDWLARFRQKYFATVYHNAPADWGPADGEFARVLASDTLTDPDRAAITDARSTYHRAINTILDELLDTADARLRSNASHAIRMTFGDDDYVYEDADIYVRRENDCRTRHRRANNEALIALRALLDDIAPGQFTIRRPSEDDAPLPWADKHLSSMIMTDAEGTVRLGYRSMPSELATAQIQPPDLIHPLNRRDLTRWATRHHLTDDDLALAEAVHDDYLDAWSSARSDGALAVTRDVLAIERAPGPTLTWPDADTIADHFRAWRRALEAMRNLDRSLYDGLDAVFDGLLEADVLLALQRQREQDLLRRAPAPREMLMQFDARRHEVFDGRERTDLDLRSIVDELTLPDDIAAALQPRLAAYEKAVTAELRKSFDAYLVVKEEQAILMANSLSLDPEDGLVAEGLEPTDTLRAAEATMVDAHRSLLTLHRALRDDLERDLPDPLRAEFRRAYRRAGWPGLYADAGALHDLFSSVLREAVLTDDVRQRLADLQASYVADHERLSDSMVDKAGDWSAQHATRTEREQLNERARGRLRDLIGPEAVDRWFNTNSDTPDDDGP